MVVDAGGKEKMIEREELRAVVTTNRWRGVAVLQWRVLISEKLVDDGDEGETMIPTYGKTVAWLERSAHEFYHHKGSLSDYVSKWLPRPKMGLIEEIEEPKI